MKLETFFEKFDQFADAPDAVVKMRELILRLAIQGKLVSQNPRDEPADRLVLELKAEVSDKTGRRTALLPPIAPDEIPFELPAGWVWERLGNIGETNIGLTYSPQDVSDVGTPVLRSSNVQNGKLDFDDLVRVTCEPKQSVMVKDGDLLICARNGSRALVGKVAVIENLNEPAAFGAFMAIFRSRVNTFLYHFICSPLFRRMIDEVNTTTINQITQNNLRSTLAPIPPLAEQKRIVAKVNELMALCDRLALQQQERETRHAALARASLARFADAPTPANLPFLFHPSYAIPPADLRKSILTLAVQGKLVPQDPNDEPAETILRATSGLFERLVAAKQISSPKPLPPIEECDFPFSLPSGWAWCRLGQIIRISSGDGLVAKDMNDGPIPVYGGNGVNGYHDAHNVAKRTLVIGRVGFYCGSIHVTPEKAWVTDNAFITTFDEEHIDMDFLSRLLKATDLRERDNATAQPVISGGKVYPTILALPPLAEQRRIVAKVEQLMALVDALETQLATSRATAANLLSALVAELTGTPNDGKVSVPSTSTTGRRGRPPKS